MHINVSYDSTVDAAPAAFKVDVQYAVTVLDAAFSNDVTLNIHVGWGEVGGMALKSTDLGESQTAEAPTYTYSQIVGALEAQATQPNASPDLVAAVHTLSGLSDPTNGGIFDIGLAQAQALGLSPNNPTEFDGWVGFDGNASDWSFSTTKTPTGSKYYLVGTILHEITEVMGRDGSLGTAGDHYPAAWGVPDLFRFSAPGFRELAPGPAHSTGYFSIDDGQTSLGTWNNHLFRGDLADWDQGTGSGGGPGPYGWDAFNNLSDADALNQLTNTDLTLMHVLGWEAAQPQNFVINGEMYFVDVGQQSANNLVIEHGGTVEVANGGALNGTVTFHGEGGLLTIDSPTAPTNLIDGFVAGDTIDFYGATIGHHPSVKLLPGNVLQIAELGHTYDFHFDPNQNFAGQNFHVSDDGFGRTQIYIEASLTPVSSPSPNPNPGPTPNPGNAFVMVSGDGISNGSGDLDAGHVVTFTLNMNTNIIVDTTNGTPTLSLNDGEAATYAGGTGTNQLSFTYTVASGDNTPALAITAVNLNGATVQDVNGHDADLSGAVGNLQGTLQIDTTAPHLTGATATGSQSFVLSFDEPVMPSGTPTFVAGNQQGDYDAAATAALHDHTKVVFDFGPSGFVFPQPAGQELTGITDLAGNAPLVDAVTMTQANPALAAVMALGEVANELSGGHLSAQSFDGPTADGLQHQAESLTHLFHLLV